MKHLNLLVRQAARFALVELRNDDTILEDHYFNFSGNDYEKSEI